MKKTVFIVLGTIAAISILFVLLIVLPAVEEYNSKKRVFSDLQIRLDEVSSTVIGILPKTVEGGVVIYGSGGSGVIFERDKNTYYALTAAHVVADENASYKAYTVFNEYSDKVDENFYYKLADVNIEYISPTTDLAVVSFYYGEELNVARLENNMPNRFDRIMCIGHPDGKKQTVSYGYITSDLKRVGISNTDLHSRSVYYVLEHNAYLNSGSSGGPAFSENMKLAGINTGGLFGIFGRFRKGYLMPCDQLSECIMQWKDGKTE
ncbi:MAG: trypsin-like peptidase domain-containing protein [Clostridia bacterium]|nr:trypsin-like peptidase domain-containing protein [Clostridia bacterium]